MATRRGQLMRVALLGAVSLVAALAGSVPASWSYWSGGDEPVYGTGAGGAATLGGGTTPIVGTAGSANAAVHWGPTTLNAGGDADGYVIRRYDGITDEEETVGEDCAGTIVALTCTESDLPSGRWRYTVTPVFGGNWHGAESARSGPVITGSATLELAQTVYGAGLPTQTTGSLTGFAANEAITYTLDDVSIDGSPSHVAANGNAAITALTIPDVADGPHTVIVEGVVSGLMASAGILVDTVPPVLSTSVTPDPNAAGWNRTPVEIDISSDDGEGSGVVFVKGTLDGSDPRTSPTATLYEGDPVLVEQTSTIKYYGVDLAGNETSVATLEVKIDATGPLLTGLETIDVTGGAYVAPPSEALPNGAIVYRGAAAGSFRFRATASDVGGSGVASFATTSLAGAAGFSHTPTLITTPAGGPYESALYSWAAGTTSTPSGTIVLTDVAGNTTVAAGSLYNDSTAPAGGSVDATDLVGSGSRYKRSTTVDLALGPGTDTGAGLAVGAQLLRASATLTSSGGVANGVCGTYGSFAQIGGDDPGATVSDTVPDDGRCYRYAYTVPDHVGNLATYTSPDIKVEATPPSSLTPSGVVITPVTGAGAQFVSGSTVYYKPAQTGSFTVEASASDASSGITEVSFPTIAGFAGGGLVTTPVSGTTFRTTYTWSNNVGSSSPGLQSVTATDHAGHVGTNAAAFSLEKDSSAPTHTLSLGSETHAYLDAAAGKLWYNDDLAGSFTLVDALADDSSGPASVSYPALATTGWVHAAQTVSTPSGGPYTSAAFSWGVHPNNPPTYTVTGQDRIGTTGTTALTFAVDSTTPAGGDIDYFNGALTVPSVPITLTIGSDTGSGIATAIVQRDEASLDVASGTCGTFPATFATAVTLEGGADTSVTTAHCYKYRYVVTDRVDLQRIYTPGANIVKLDTTPKVTAIVSQQAAGTAGDGRLQVGDKLILTFNVPLAAASVPTTFSGATEQRLALGNVLLTIPGITSGALNTGSILYLAGIGAVTATFAGTVALNNAGALTSVTITVTTLTGATTLMSSGKLVFTPAATITGNDGNPAAGIFNTANGFKLF